MDLVERTAGTALFRGMSAKTVEDLVCRLNAVGRTYRRGEILAHAGLEASRLFVLASGRLHVYGERSGGREMLVREIMPGEVLGLWILHVPEEKSWPGTVLAAEDTEVVSLGMAETRRLLATGGRAAEQLSANMSAILARELFSTWRKLVVMDEPTVESRVQAYLAELAGRSGGSGEVVVPFDRERMAAYLGVTRPALSRALGRLRDRGVLTWRKNSFRMCGRWTDW